MRQPVRVLIAADHICYPGNVQHGGTTYFLNTLPHLTGTDDVHVTMCFLGPEEPISERLKKAGIDAIYLGRKKWDPRPLLELVNLLREREIDIIHVHGMKSILLGRLAARWAGCRSIVHLHDTNPASLPIRVMQRWLMRWTDLVVGVSQHTTTWATDYFRAPAERSCTVHNGVDLSQTQLRAAGKRAETRASLNCTESTLVVSIIARFHPVKRQDRLIAMVPAIRARCPNLEVWCIGDGHTRAECERQATDLGVSDVVRFLGQRKDVPALLAATDVLAIVSDVEGLPFVAVEALSIGVPVVSLATGGIADAVIDGVTGRVIPHGNDREYIDALVELLTDDDLRRRFGESARRDIQRFDIAFLSRRLREVYRKVFDTPALLRRSSGARRPQER